MDFWDFHQISENFLVHCLVDSGKLSPEFSRHAFLMSFFYWKEIWLKFSKKNNRRTCMLPVRCWKSNTISCLIFGDTVLTHKWCWMDPMAPITMIVTVRLYPSLASPSYFIRPPRSTWIQRIGWEHIVWARSDMCLCWIASRLTAPVV